MAIAPGNQIFDLIIGGMMVYTSFIIFISLKINFLIINFKVQKYIIYIIYLYINNILNFDYWGYVKKCIFSNR